MQLKIQHYLRQGSQLLNLPNFLLVSYTLFLAGFYFIPNAVDQYKFYGVAVFLPGLFTIKFLLGALKNNLLWHAILAYLLYMLLTSVWSTDFSATQLFYDARLVAYILVFVLLTVFIFQRNSKQLDVIIRLTCISASFAAIISIFQWYSSHPFPSSRLIGIGTIENPNPSAFIYGFFAIYACYYALHTSNIKARLTFASPCVALLIFVLLTGSKTGALATASAVALLLVIHTHHHKLLLAGSVLACIGTVVYLLWQLGIFSSPADYGFVSRLAIWGNVLDQALTAPLFGNGFQRELLLTPSGSLAEENYTHNTFLASFRDGGITGLLLHLFVMGTAIHIAVQHIKKHKDPIYLILLVFGLICMSADTDQLITRPRELWIIFWLPLALLVGQRLTEARSVSRQEAG